MVGENEQISVDVNDVIEHLLQAISGQALQIAKLEALNKKLIMEVEDSRKFKAE